MPPHPTSWRSILILSSHQCLCLPSCLFPSGFPSTILYTPLLSPIHATCSAHLTLLNFITQIIFGEEYRSWSLLYSFLLSHIFLSLLGPNVLTPYSHTPQPTFLPHCERPCFTQVQNNRQNYSSVFIHSLVFSPIGRSGRSQSPVMEPIWLLAYCILGKFLGVVCHCLPLPLDVLTFAAMCLCVHSNARDPSSERWNCGRERCPVVILPKFRLPRKFRDLLHAVNLRIFSP